MSETDDTDDLLLIPPDFFIIDSEQEDSLFSKKTLVPYYEVVDCLIQQVHKLENRVNSIESASDISLISNSCDNTLHVPGNTNNLMTEERRFYSSDDLQNLRENFYFESTQSTPQKPKTKFHLKSLPNTPKARCNSKRQNKNICNDGHLQRSPSNRLFLKESFKPNTSDGQRNDVLEEIDHFISNVNIIKKIQASRNIFPDFTYPEQKSNLNLDDIDQMLKKIDLEQTAIGKSSEAVAVNEVVAKKNEWRCGDNVNTVPDYGTGMRNIMFMEAEKCSKPFLEDVSKSRSPAIASEYSPTDISTMNESASNNKSSSISSSESTQTTALHNTAKATGDNRCNTSNVNSDRNVQSIHSDALHVINLHKKICMQNNPNSNNNKKFSTKQTPFDFGSEKSNPSLMSLTNLWSQNHSKNKHNILQKLEEEKLRRQHCEQLIQQLQSRTLELQERLAVAMQVDQAKDEAILRFHEAWEKVALKIQNFAGEKDRLENEIEMIKEKNSKDIEELNQKIQHYENEASKALNLAHVNQEKSAVLESTCTDTKNKADFLESKLRELQQNYNSEVQKNRQINELIAQKDIELNDKKNILNEAHKEIAQSKTAVENCQAEITSLKTECTQVHQMLNEERERVGSLEKQKKRLLSEIESHKKIEKGLQDDINKAKELNEQNKVELRNFYQDQVETVVREKLQEFQLQLDKAESALQEELKNREMTVAKRAAEHIRHLSEKHALEISLIEERHKEEIRLYNLQITQNQQQIENLQFKFQQQKEHRQNIAQELRKVMEAQWMEAIRIINSNRSPVAPQNLDYNTIDQLNSLKSKSYINVEELLLNVKEDNDNEKHFKHTNEERGKNSFQPIQSVESLSSIIDEDSPVKYPKHDFGIPVDTPITSRSLKNKQQAEYDLQKFVRMLLNRSPGNPTEEQFPRNANAHLKVIPSAATDNDNHSWQFPLNAQEEHRPVKGTSKDKKMGKRPWK